MVLGERSVSKSMLVLPYLCVCIITNARDRYRQALITSAAGDSPEPQEAELEIQVLLEQGRQPAAMGRGLASLPWG